MLKRCVFRVCLLGVTVLPAAAGNIDDDLYYTLATRDAGETVSALIYLLDTVDFDALSAVLDAERATLQRRHEVVVTALRDKAAATQKPLLAELEKLAAAGRVKIGRAHV